MVHVSNTSVKILKNSSTTGISPLFPPLGFLQPYHPPSCTNSSRQSWLLVNTNLCSFHRQMIKQTILYTPHETHHETLLNNKKGMNNWCKQQLRWWIKELCWLKKTSFLHIFSLFFFSLFFLSIDHFFSVCRTSFS